MMIDKYIIMKILRERSIISYDEYNYKDIEFTIIKPTIITKSSIVVRFVNSFNEWIYVEYYKKFCRDYKINNLLDG